MAQLHFDGVDGAPDFVDIIVDDLPETQMPLLFNQIAPSEATPAGDTELMLKLERDTEDQCESTSTDSKNFKCTECTLKFKTEEHRVRHVRKAHRGENPFQCVMCEYTTYNTVSFKEHNHRHQGLKPYKCSKCDHRSASKKNAKKHEESQHRANNPRKCDQCGFIARHKKGLTAHKVKEHNETYKCPECNEVFSSQIKIKNHKKTIRTCDICSVTTCTKKQFTAHMDEVHNMKGKLQNVTSEENSTKKFFFRCAICKWKSNAKLKILLHLIHHPDQPIDEDKLDVTILRECGIIT